MLNAAKFTRVYGHMTEFWGGGEMGGVGGGGVGGAQVLVLRCTAHILFTNIQVVPQKQIFILNMSAPSNCLQEFFFTH